MKCDELTVYVPQDGPYGLETQDDHNIVEEETCYLKSEVDAAIKELKDKIRMHDFFWEGCGFDKLGFKNSIGVRDYCDKLKAENESFKYSIATLETDIAMLKRWRKVSEELPEDDAEVLATDGDGIWICHKDTMPDGSPWFQPDGLPHIDDITHWMPLPELPKELK